MGPLIKDENACYCVLCHVILCCSSALDSCILDFIFITVKPANVSWNVLQSEIASLNQGRWLIFINFDIRYIHSILFTSMPIKSTVIMEKLSFYKDDKKCTNSNYGSLTCTYFRFFLYTYVYLNFEPILDDKLKEKFLKPWKGVLCSPLSCVFVGRLQSTLFEIET